MPFAHPKVVVPLDVRLYCFMLLPPVYLLIWLAGWLAGYTWEKGLFLAPRLHRVWVLVEWEDMLDSMRKSAVETGRVSAHQISAALLPYTPEEK